MIFLPPGVAEVSVLLRGRKPVPELESGLLPELVPGRELGQEPRPEPGLVPKLVPGREHGKELGFYLLLLWQSGRMEGAYLAMLLPPSGRLHTIYGFVSLDFLDHLNFLPRDLRRAFVSLSAFAVLFCLFSLSGACAYQPTQRFVRLYSLDGLRIVLFSHLALRTAALRTQSVLTLYRHLRSRLSLVAAH